MATGVSWKAIKHGKYYESQLHQYCYSKLNSHERIVGKNCLAQYILYVPSILTPLLVFFVPRFSIYEQYRHPHIAYAALEVFLAAERYPNKCGKTWLENNPDFINRERLQTGLTFPIMESAEFGEDTVENWLAQPLLLYDYIKPFPELVAGDRFVNSVVLA